MAKILSAKLPVTLEMLPHLSEAFSKALNSEITEAFRDCNIRPKMKKPRTITVKLSFVPVVDMESNDTDCQQVSVGFHVGPVARPAKIPDDCRVQINRNHQGFFHADFPHDDPRTKGLFDKQVVEKPLLTEQKPK